MAIERQVLFAPDFLRQAKHLRKKYQRLDDDLAELLNQLRLGDTPGSRIPGVEAVAYKVRLKSSDQSKGKRGGFRAVYYLRKQDTVVLLSIYIKNQRADLTSERIRQIISEFEQLSRQDDEQS